MVHTTIGDIISQDVKATLYSNAHYETVKMEEFDLWLDAQDSYFYYDNPTGGEHCN